MFEFRPSYLKAGPGISKEQAIDHGAKRFFRIYFREFWPLAGLNLLFIVCCIPMFTAFPAWKALSAVTGKLAAGENVFYLAEFRKAFLENLSRTFLGGVILTLGIAVCSGAAVFYLSVIGGVAGVLLSGFALSIALFLGLVSWCFSPLCLQEQEETLGILLKKSFAYGIVGLRYHLPALLLSLLLLALCVLVLPWSLPLLLGWVFSFIAYLNAYTMRATNQLLLHRFSDREN